MKRHRALGVDSGSSNYLTSVEISSKVDDLYRKRRPDGFAGKIAIENFPAGVVQISSKVDDLYCKRRPDRFETSNLKTPKIRKIGKSVPPFGPPVRTPRGPPDTKTGDFRLIGYVVHRKITSNFSWGSTDSRNTILLFTYGF